MSEPQTLLSDSESRNPYHHGSLKAVLVANAFRVLEEKGIEELSLRDLADKAGVSKNAPYRHFASKNDLLTVLAADGFREFADIMESSARQGRLSGPPNDELANCLNALREMFRGYLAFARRRPACYRLMFSPLGYSLHSETCRSNSLRAFGVLIENVQLAHDAGWRHDEDPLGKGLQIWASLHGWVGIINDGLLPEYLAEAADYPLENLLFGVAPPA